MHLKLLYTLLFFCGLGHVSSPGEDCNRRCPSTPPETTREIVRAASCSTTREAARKAVPLEVSSGSVKPAATSGSTTRPAGAAIGSQIGITLAGQEGMPEYSDYQVLRFFNI